MDSSSLTPRLLPRAPLTVIKPDSLGLSSCEAALEKIDSEFPLCKMGPKPYFPVVLSPDEVHLRARKRSPRCSVCLSARLFTSPPGVTHYEQNMLIFKWWKQSWRDSSASGRPFFFAKPDLLSLIPGSHMGGGENRLLPIDL